MNKWIVFFLVVAVLSAAVGAESPLANAGRRGLQAKTIDEMLALPDEEIDIGLGALLTGKEYDPTLDVPKYLALLDRMAEELRTRIGDEKSPRKIVGLLNEYIFTRGGYAALAEDEGKEENLLHVLLDKRKGPCASLSTLYLALAERVGLPLFGVCPPSHVFVRYESGKTKINVEPTRRGERLSDTSYAARFRVPRTDAARSFYMRSLTKRQFLAGLLSNLGVAYRTKEKLDDAVEAYIKALAINPNLAEAWTNLGVAYRTQGKFDEAVRAYRRALASNPDYAEAWSNLGVAYRNQGKLDEAVDAYAKALLINPNCAEAWTNLGVAYRSQGKSDEAVHAYRRAISINPKDYKAWSNLGNAWRSLGKLDKAAEAHTKALSVNPNYAEAWNNLAATYYDMGDYASAWESVRKCWRASGEVHPDFLQSLRRRMPEPLQ